MISLNTLCIEERISLNAARGVFQCPVATEGGGTGGIGRGRNVGAGEAAQSADKVDTGRSLRNIAAIQQDVTLGSERCADGRHLTTQIGQVAAGENAVADFGHPWRTVAEQVNGGNIALSMKRRQHPVDAVFIRLHQYDLDARANAVGQCLPVGEPGIDEGDFLD